MDQILINLKGLVTQPLSLFSGNHLANDLFVHDVILEHTLHEYHQLPNNKVITIYKNTCFLNTEKVNKELYGKWFKETYDAIINIVDNEFKKLRNPEDFVLRYTTDVNTYIFREGSTET